MRTEALRPREDDRGKPTGQSASDGFQTCRKAGGIGTHPPGSAGVRGPILTTRLLGNHVCNPPGSRYSGPGLSTRPQRRRTSSGLACYVRQAELLLFQSESQFCSAQSQDLCYLRSRRWAATPKGVTWDPQVFVHPQPQGCTSAGSHFSTLLNTSVGTMTYPGQ